MMMMLGSLFFSVEGYSLGVKEKTNRQLKNK
jgi:hypothetical protein